MSKEQLESLKRNREWTEATGGKFYTVDSDDYKWLIKQAERVQELERKIERYREALEFYADKENYEPEHYDPDTHDYTSMIDHDKGATARKALEGTE